MEIIWSPEAEETYIKTLRLILEKWTPKEALLFDEEIELFLKNLKRFKKLCPPTKKNPALRKCIVSKQTSLIYQIKNKNTIELVSFIDNRSLHSF